MYQLVTFIYLLYRHCDNTDLEFYLLIDFLDEDAFLLQSHDAVCKIVERRSLDGDLHLWFDRFHLTQMSHDYPWLYIFPFDTSISILF